MAEAKDKDKPKPADQIRQAWNSGKKTVTIDGVLYNIVKQSKQKGFTFNGETHQQVEEWLVATVPEGAASGRMFSVEAVPGKNSRLRTKKKEKETK